MTLPDPTPPPDPTLQATPSPPPDARPQSAPPGPRAVAPDTPPPVDPSTNPAQPAADLDLFGNAPAHHPDWSHRRGEPRVLALLWTIFLTVLATTTLMRGAVAGRMDIDVYRESLRAALAIILTAILLVWPLIRLSQAPPREPSPRAALKDALIAIVPLQAVLWPQVILAHWPIPVVASLAFLLAAWSLLIGAVLAMALRAADSPRSRVPAMLLIVLLVTLPTLATLLLEATLHPAGPSATPWWRLLSPHAALYELTADRDRFGQAPSVNTTHLAVLLTLLTLALLAWLAAWARHILAPLPSASAQPPSPTGTTLPLAPDAQAR